MRLKRRRLLCVVCLLIALVLVNIIASLPGEGAAAARRGGDRAEVLTERRPGLAADPAAGRGRRHLGDDGSSEWLPVEPRLPEPSRNRKAKAARVGAGGDAAGDASDGRRARRGHGEQERANIVDLIRGHGGWLGELGGNWLAEKFSFFRGERGPDPPPPPPSPAARGAGERRARKNVPDIPDRASRKSSPIAEGAAPDPRLCAALGLALDESGAGVGGRGNAGPLPPGASPPPPWLSEEDLRILRLLSGGTVRRKETLPGHGAVLRLTMAPAAAAGSPPPAPPVEEGRDYCAEGACALAKRTSDAYEVLAFHLDRVLGLRRTPPAVSRRLDSWLLPYRFTNGTARPLLWWVPDIQRVSDGSNEEGDDQNSFRLTWPQYQAVLRGECHGGPGAGGAVKAGVVAGGGGGPAAVACPPVSHSEWGRLALFDFLLQVYDRLDRGCCGFIPDPRDSCVEQGLNDKCDRPEHQRLVHVVVRRSDPGRLVFIDNAGRPFQEEDNLNFRVLEGITQFPGRAVRVLESPCFGPALLHSLHSDKAFWESQGGRAGVRRLVSAVEARGRALLRRIRERGIATSSAA